jgi:hypothetical protein
LGRFERNDPFNTSHEPFPLVLFLKLELNPLESLILRREIPQSKYFSVIDTFERKLVRWREGTDERGRERD